MALYENQTKLSQLAAKIGDFITEAADDSEGRATVPRASLAFDSYFQVTDSVFLLHLPVLADWARAQAIGSKSP